MKTAIGVVGLVVLYVVSVIVFTKLRHAFGVAPVGIVSLVCAGMAAWVAGPESRQLAEWVSGALHDIRMPLKVAAITIGMDEARACRELKCVDRLDFHKWSTLGPKFLDAFAVQVLRTHGNHTVIENGLLARAVNKLEDFILSEQSAPAARRIA